MKGYKTDQLGEKVTICIDQVSKSTLSVSYVKQVSCHKTKHPMNVQVSQVLNKVVDCLLDWLDSF